MGRKTDSLSTSEKMSHGQPPTFKARKSREALLTELGAIVAVDISAE